MSQTIEPKPGEHISHAAARALAIAIKTRQDVAFNFNDTPVVARPTDSHGDVIARWEATRDRMQAEWRASDEGRRYAAGQERARRKSQDMADSVVAELPNAAGDLDALLPLLADLAEAIRTDTKWEPEKLAGVLERAGYVKDEYVGHQPKSDFYSDTTILGRWIVGQAIACFRQGMPPHGVTGAFVMRYQDLRRQVQP